MRNALTPRDLATAIGVSESSLRRWVDSGEIQTYRTRGGHRRIPMAEALRFVRDSGSAVLRPEALGLAAAVESAQGGPAVAERLFESLRHGQQEQAAGIVLSLFMAGEPVAAICDGPLREAMHRAGELWHHSRAGILQEHRATEIVTHIILQLRQGLAPARSEAPLALGGAAEADVYTLPSLMADLVLADAGFQTINFGARTPVDLLADAADEKHAALVWLSISVDLPKERLRTDLHRLARRLNDQNRILIVGGRHASDINMSRLPNVITGSSMRQLADIARGMQLARKAS